MSAVAEDILIELQRTSSQKRAFHSLRFFRTGKGEYGEGDKFLGHSVPEQRKIAARSWKEASFQDVAELLKSEWHEARLIGLVILVKQYSQALTEENKKSIFTCYVENLPRINNWDLVDISAPYIPGLYLREHPELLKTLWLKWLNSSILWERRVAVLSTFPFIKQGSFAPTLQAATTLLQDKEDLMHKAMGWLLREVGKRDTTVLESFLEQHAHDMPRTMLRYAIEKFPPEERAQWLQKKALFYRKM